MELKEAFDYISLIIAAVFSLHMLVIPAYYALIILKNRNHLEDPDFVTRYGVLYQSIKTTSSMTLMTYQLILLRRFLLVVVLCFLVFSVHLQVGLIILISASAPLHMLFVRPFKEIKDNLSTTLSDTAYTVAATQLPFLAMKINETLAGDILIYTLMAATILYGVISAVFLVPALVRLYRKYCKKPANRIEIEVI